MICYLSSNLIKRNYLYKPALGYGRLTTDTPGLVQKHFNLLQWKFYCLILASQVFFYSLCDKSFKVGDFNSLLLNCGSIFDDFIL